MTIKLNFDKTDLRKLLNHIKWLKEVGLISSYDINNPDSEDKETIKFIQNLIEEAEKDIAEGRVYTTEEAKQILANWQQTPE